MTAPTKLYLAPSKTCSGQVVLPGSKSIANRALLMAALCDTPTVLTNLLVSDDTRHMRNALAALGVAQQELSDNGRTLQVNGCGGSWTSQPGELFLGNAGTAVRPLTAVLAATIKHSVVITGEPRMLERPLAPLIDALVMGGAEIKSTGEPGYPPVTIAGGLQGGAIQVDGSASSQFISALLMALPLAPNNSVLTLTGTIVSWPYIELTLSMLKVFGIEITQLTENSFEIAGAQRYRSPGEYWIEGDASAASYWLAAGVIGGGPVQVAGAGSQSLQGDVAFAEVLQRMGANIDVQPQHMTAQGVTEQSGQLRGIDVDLNAIPDAAMTLATLALFADGPTRIRNVANWRLKETDRLLAMATELKKVGAEVKLFDDGLLIHPPQQWQHAEIETYNDHRMAMCFALLTFAPVGVTILDPDCCAKTYPEFFTEFSQRCH
ncbi:3-phosphoshikimate 1-carboxyvinyltransferase [Pseudidiomarina planktonica]|uniref:3-phosphoshikimate 1-carboxyvinyltransferase n=1 Tax=Pseudidiomarina planktonica TaxID=1323738 RepID=A0A1Y6ET06_9GAMM|nr:3-phosphoshikimate 1-carboxyvinyltransferase [Pseudidiomarina planktonica]RUO65353.1 3-phosphoshikimate 1-carboxyvinyltransferase [Pseudidiomarina planktonica]SMQ65359.1 3-phosphoshikimate 1-carboxyvinyltransferase [Pseudidiomarina planktonica]